MPTYAIEVIEVDKKLWCDRIIAKKFNKPKQFLTSFIVNNIDATTNCQADIQQTRQSPLINYTCNWVKTDFTGVKYPQICVNLSSLKQHKDGQQKCLYCIWRIELQSSFEF